MKLKNHPTLVSGFLAGSLALLATGCVDPYATGHGPGPQVSHYHSGYEVRSLPPGYRTETYNGTRYYNAGGTYYRPRSGGYVVVDAPRHPSYDRPSNYRPPGDRHDDRYDNDRHRGGDGDLDRLPSGARQIKRDGETYYQVNNRYYQRRGSHYVPVDRPR